MAAATLRRREGSTSTSSSGSTASAGSTSSSTGGAQNPNPCNAIEQDCVEPDAGKCGYWFSSESFECAEVLGDARDGEPCEYPDDGGGGDTCAPGFFCTTDGQPSTDDRACTSYRDEATPCADGKACAALAVPAKEFGLCIFTCEIFGECARPAGHGDARGQRRPRAAGRSTIMPGTTPQIFMACAVCGHRLQRLLLGDIVSPTRRRP